MFRSFHTGSVSFKAGKILGRLVNLSKDVIQLPFMVHRILQRDYSFLCLELSVHERLGTSEVENRALHFSVLRISQLLPGQIQILWGSFGTICASRDSLSDT